MTVAVAPLAVPNEHGGWGLLLEPIALALIVSPSIAGAMLGIGTVAAFLMRHPLKLAVRDWRNGRVYPRTRVCAMLAAGYGMAGCAAFAVAWPMSAVLVAALPVAALQFSYDIRNRGRDRTAELSGAAIPILIAAAIASWPVALLAAARSLPAVLYVRSALRGESRALMIAAHVAAIGCAVALRNWTAVLAMMMLLIRALLPADLTARVIGMREVAYGIVAIAFIAIGF